MLKLHIFNFRFKITKKKTVENELKWDCEFDKRNLNKNNHPQWNGEISTTTAKKKWLRNSIAMKLETPTYNFIMSFRVFIYTRLCVFGRGECCLWRKRQFANHFFFRCFTLLHFKCGKFPKDIFAAKRFKRFSCKMWPVALSQRRWHASNIQNHNQNDRMRERDPILKLIRNDEWVSMSHKTEHINHTYRELCRSLNKHWVSLLFRLCFSPFRYFIANFLFSWLPFIHKCTYSRRCESVMATEMLAPQ